MGSSRRVLTLTAVLSVAVFFGFGLLVSAIAVVLPSMIDDLGWTNAAISAGLTVGLLTAGAVAPAVGRFIDEHGGRLPMVAGAMLTTAGMWSWAQVASYPAYLTTWVVLGLGMSLVVYEAAFTTLIRHAPAMRRQGLLVITFSGALSATAFLPLIDLLVRAGGWRQALAVLGAANLLVVAPLLAVGVPPRGTVVAAETRIAATTISPLEMNAASALVSGPGTGGTQDEQVQDPRFRRIVLTALLGDAPVYAVSAHIVTYLIMSGRSPSFAALVGSTIGIAKLLGRLGVGLLVRRFSAYALLMCGYVLAGLALAMPLLPLGGALEGALGSAVDVVMAIGFGVGSGMQTVSRPLYVTELYGTAGFGRTFGRIARAGRSSMAVAPLLVGLSVTATGGYGAAWTAMAVGSLAAARALPSSDRAARSDGWSRRPDATSSGEV